MLIVILMLFPVNVKLFAIRNREYELKTIMELIDALEQIPDDRFIQTLFPNITLSSVLQSNKPNNSACSSELKRCNPSVSCCCYNGCGHSPYCDSKCNSNEIKTLSFEKENDVKKNSKICNNIEVNCNKKQSCCCYRGCLVPYCQANCNAKQ